MSRSALVTLALSFALGGTLTGCSGADQPAPDGSEASPTPTLSAGPTRVSFGDAQSVTWAPASNVSSELSIRVDEVRESRLADFAGLVATGITEDNQPYYVDVVVANEGGGELGGLDVPLYLADSNGTLTPPSRFADPFEPCPSGPLPTSFGAGEKTEMCLVFFSSPGARFESITFQPDVDTAAVRWTGDVALPAKKASPKPRTKPRSKQKRR